MKHTLSIDSSAFLHRAKHTLGGKLCFKEADTGILYGFLHQLGKMCNRYQTNRVVFALDSKRSKRKDIYPDYKNNRKKAEKSDKEIEFDNYCYDRFSEVEEQLRKMGFPNIWKCDGYEGDDIIATFLDRYPDYAKNTIVVSSDNDFYQLLGKCKGMYNSKNMLYTKTHLLQEYGIKPAQWATVKKICGCASDNVKSVPGVGYGKAVQYVKGELKGKLLDLVESEEMEPVIKMAGKLTKLPFDKKVDIPEFVPEAKLDHDYFLKMCMDFGFNSIIADSERFKMWERIFNGSFAIDKDKEKNKKRTTF